MLFQHSKHARRVAACTALALSAGMLLAGTASAADTPAPLPSVKKEAPSFTPPKLTLPKKGAARAGVAAAGEAASQPLSDLDGDGIDDLILRGVEGELYTSTSTGAGDVFDLFRDYTDVAKDIVPIGQQGGATTEPEVLVLSENGTLKLYADADPTGTPYEHVVGGGWQVYNKVTSPGDVNGDGRADVVARTKDGQLYLYLATGNLDAPFGARILIGGGWGAYDQLVGLGDANGDGKGDLYARDTASGTLYFYAGTGSTTQPFAARQSVGGGWNIYNQILPAGDGDLLARDNAGTLFYYPANGNGTLAARQQSSDAGAWAGVQQFAGAGNNAYTGKEGVFATTPGGALYWYYNSTTGKLDPRMEILPAGSLTGGPAPLHFSSMNADGVSDFAAVVDGHLWVDDADLGGGWGAYNTLVAPGDLSGDGKGDLLARTSGGDLYLYKGNGAGTALAARVKVGTGWGIYNKIVGAGDYTGDGRTDIVARTSGGDLYLYAGTGNATTPFKSRLKIGTGWNTYSKIVAPGDLNADGKGDLLGVTSGGDLYRYLNTTSGKFTARVKLGGGWGIYNSVQ
ncbi:FG-GAP repeat domain-containing protein [Streptomyces sp. NPDC057027]|uniref:FG-GAP repeat domain-containing protein n=1 Tax=Streptomyces sp. NPDC057027 TaxID=3346004 RepID=UPI003637FD0D